MDNYQRAQSALKAIQTFSAETGLEGEELDIPMTDLLCNLQHLAEAQGVDFQECLDRANRHYVNEIESECHEW